MIGYRHLLVILCSMFMMLGIGILLGAVANFTPEVDKQQAATIKKLTQNLDVITSESDKDEQRLRGNEEALSALIPGYVSNTLTGKRFAIIQTGNYSNSVHLADQAISAAGGTVVSTTVLTNRLTQMDQGRIDRIAGSLTLAQPSSQSDYSLSQILRPLVWALHAGTTNLASSQSDISKLIAEGLMTQLGDISQPVSGIIIVAGEADDSVVNAQSQTSEGNVIDQALLSDISDIAPHLKVVGCEPYDAAKSDVPDFTSASVSSVDCIDLPMGDLDLPYALRDNGGTNYGLKATSSQRTPSNLSVISNNAPASDNNGSSYPSQ